MIFNETPVRTSRNFNINNIKLDDINFGNINKFSNCNIENNSKNIKIDENVSKIDLKYGLNQDIVNEVNEKSNKKIKISINSKKSQDEHVEFDFKFDKNNLQLVENIEIDANSNSSATVIVKYESLESINAYHNGILRVWAKENSNLNVIIVNLMNDDSNNFISIENNLDKNAKINYTIVDFGGKNSITNYYSNLYGDESENNLSTIYLGKKDQLFDLNYIGELKGIKTNINIEVQGALKDNSRKHFKGTIDFKKGCKKAKGNENEACMLLSDTAKSLALPMLLCSEEDVEGNHSTSSGKIGDKELFYIMSRGFEKKEAQKLMVRAKFNKILTNIKDEKIKSMVLDEIDKRLN